MIKSLTLKGREFPINLIQGPLAGYSNAPFRALTWRFGKPAFSCTEMISAKALLYQAAPAQQRFTSIDPSEGPVCFQLAGDDPHILGEAAKIVTDKGADLIDLNCGCPVKKIRSKNAGSRLLANPQHLYRLIKALKNNTHLPVSIKIRVDANSGEKFNPEVARAVTEGGADFLIIHARHWSHRYDVPCYYDDLRYFVESVKIPVIGNGDVTCLVTLKNLFETGCQGAMIARAGVGQPWLIQKLLAESLQQNYEIPNAKEIGCIFIEHIQQLIKLYRNEKIAILHARKLVKYYARALVGKVDLMKEVNECSSFSTLYEICNRYFKCSFEKGN